MPLKNSPKDGEINERARINWYALIIMLSFCSSTDSTSPAVNHGF